MAKVEVVVNEVEEEVEHRPLQEASHKMVLASIGAMAIAQEAMVDCVTRFVERGERVEKEGRRLVRERMEKRRHQVRKVVKRRQEKAEKVEDELQQEAADLLDRRNVPTKDDIEALSAKISELTKKVDELKKA